MGKGIGHVISCAESLPETELFRFVSSAREFRRTLRQGPWLPNRQKGGGRGCHRTDLLCRGHGLYLVLERGAVSAAIGGHGVPAQTLWHTSSDGHRSTADALQSPRLGGSRRSRGQRQAVHDGDLRSARQVLKQD